MNIQSWGKLPKLDHSSISYINPDSKFEFDDMHYLPYGLGRSYGDSCLNENGNLIITEQLADISHFDKETGILVCGSGISLKKVLKTIVNFGWFLPVVPGTQNVTIGGAIAMNAGAHGAETADFLDEIEWMDMDGILHSTPKDKLEFRYRYSELNGNLGKIITRAVLALNESDPETVEKKTLECRQFRIEKQPYNQPSCGSVFKNPPGDYAARLIETSGLKGKIKGDAQISPKQANFIVNLGKASSDDILSLINTIRETVLRNYSIDLMPEVQILQS